MRHPTSLLALLTWATLAAQAPPLMSFQAVIRDGGEALVTNAQVGMRLSLLQGADNGPAAYVETHVLQSNANGLVTLAIGGGSSVSGSLDAVDWGNGPWFLRTETDPNGGSNYSITGASQLLSVPYALYAANSEPGPQGPQGPPGSSDCPIIHTADGRAVVYTATTAHGWGLASTGGTQWSNTAITGPVLGSIASDSSVVIWTATTAYGYGLASTGGSQWFQTALAGTPVGGLAASGRIVVFTQTNAYGFGRASTGSTNWQTTTLAGPVVDHVVAGNRIVLMTNTTAYGYGPSSTGGSIWSPTSLSGPPLGGAGTR